MEETIINIIRNFNEKYEGELHLYFKLISKVQQVGYDRDLIKGNFMYNKNVILESVKLDRRMWSFASEGLINDDKFLIDLLNVNIAMSDNFSDDVWKMTLVKRYGTRKDIVYKIAKELSEYNRSTFYALFWTEYKDDFEFVGTFLSVDEIANDPYSKPRREVLHYKKYYWKSHLRNFVHRDHKFIDYLVDFDLKIVYY